MDTLGENVPLRQNFDQVYVIEGVNLGGATPEEFETQMGEALEARVQYLETVRSLPDRDADGNALPGTGGRSDLLFAVHRDDQTPALNATRLTMDIRLLEDVLSTRNRPYRIHPDRLLGYLSPMVRRLIEDGA